MLPLLFREASVLDAEKILAPLNSEPFLKSRENQAYSKEELESIINDKEMNLVVVAEKDSEMAGFVIADIIQRKDYKYADYTALYIFEKYRKSGIMRKLMSIFEHEARERGCSYIHGSVNLRNYSSMNGLRKLGYTFGRRFMDVSKELK